MTKLKRAPEFEAVETWPVQLSGAVEVSDVGDPIDDVGTPSWALAEVVSSEGVSSPGFRIPAQVLQSAGISVGELDEGGNFSVSVMPDPGHNVPVATHGKLVHQEVYVATELGRC